MPLPRRDEQGFVLIGAVWLLLLCTVLVAILMLRAANTARAVSHEGAHFQRALDLDAATQTVAAELLIGGPRSRWWLLPARGVVIIDGRGIEVSVTSEAGRLDLNDGDPAVIGGALQGLGYSGAARERFLAALVARRAAGRMHSTADIDQLASLLGPAPGRPRCIGDLLTIDGGSAQPEPDRADPVLARALGVASSVQSSQLRGGEAVRIVAAAAAGRSVATVMRVGILGSTTIPVSRRWTASTC